MKHHPTYNPGLPSVSGDLYRVPTAKEAREMNRAAAKSLRDRGALGLPFNGFRKKKVVVICSDMKKLEKVCVKTPEP